MALLLLATAQPVAAQNPSNATLKHELDSIYAVDQRWRTILFDRSIRRNPDSLAKVLGVTKAMLSSHIFHEMQKTDSTNLERVRATLQRYDYPGKSLVGEPTNEAAWSVIQHSNDIGRYLPIIKTAAKRGELPFTLYGQMLDRQLMREGKEQLYGTQGMGYNPVNPATGRPKSQPPFIWPIKNAKKVNERRKKAGFPTTVEQNAAILGIPYRIVTLQEVAKMPKN